MTKQTEALKELLEAVEHAIEIGDWKVDGRCDPDLAINRAKKALEQDEINLNCKSVQKRLATQWGYVEQPAQEPVAFTNEDELSELKSGMTTCYMYKQAIDDNDIALYTHPAPSWQGLSDDEIQDAWYKLYPLDKNNLWDDMMIGKHLDKFAHAIEQALKEKNNV